tara:strand:- start:727 stop:1182 length:456 start_codon:yes stop_codon:yes gene_type:complete
MSTLSVDTITGKSTSTNLTIGSTPVVSASANSMTIRGEGSNQTSIQQGLAKSWCRWQSSSGTASVIDSFNHSGIVDNGPGDQTITISSAMANATYVHAGMAGGGNTNLATIQQPQDVTAVTTTVTRYQTVYGNGNLNDWSSINTALFGDLA